MLLFIININNFIFCVEKSKINIVCFRRNKMTPIRDFFTRIFMKLEELKKKINKCKDIELSSISLDDVDELTDIKIDKRKSSNEGSLSNDGGKSQNQ